MLKQTDIDEQFIQNIWDETSNEIFYISEKNIFVHSSEIEGNAKFESYASLFENRKKIFEKEEASCKKFEEKANVITNGYMKRLQILGQQYEGLINKIDDLKILNNVYKVQDEQDKQSIEIRKKDIQNKVLKIMDKERILQGAFKIYSDKIGELEKL